MTDKEIKEFISLEIGKTFELRDRNFIVSEGKNGCDGCSFTKMKTGCMFLRMVAVIPECHRNYREDKRDVIFKEVENEKN